MIWYENTVHLYVSSSVNRFFCKLIYNAPTSVCCSNHNSALFHNINEACAEKDKTKKYTFFFSENLRSKAAQELSQLAPSF